MAYIRPQESTGKETPRWSYSRSELLVGGVDGPSKVLGPLPVSGGSDLAMSSCAPSCHGASADAVRCQLFVRSGLLLFILGLTKKVLFITFAGYIKRGTSNY